MRNVLTSSCLLLAVAALLAGCADPTEGVSEARVNEPAPAAEAPAPTEPADAPIEAPEPTAAPAESTPPGAVQVLPVRTFTLTEDSVIGFEGYKVTGSHIGGFGKFDGSVTVPPDGIQYSKIDVTIDMSSTYSDDPGLTTKLVGPDFFDVEQFPEARFVSTGIEKSDDGYLVSGDLTLHGVTKNVSFPATIAVNGGKLIAEAEFTINRSDFGIEYPGMAGDLIREKVVIRLDVEGAEE